MVHKIAGEISVEQINKRNGFSSAPSNGCCSTTSPSPRWPGPLRAADHRRPVDLLIGPYATGAILSAMAVAPALPEGADPSHPSAFEAGDVPMHFSASGLAFESEKVVPTKLLDALESTGAAPETIAIVTSKFPPCSFISAGARDVATAPRLKVVLYLEYEFGKRDFAPIAARVKRRTRFPLVGTNRLDGNLLLDAFRRSATGARPVPPVSVAGSPATRRARRTPFAYSTFEAHPPIPANPAADALCKLFSERAKPAGLPYPSWKARPGV